MTESEYIARKTVILMRMQQAVASLQREIEQATDALLVLEKEYRGLRAPLGVDACIGCQCDVPPGTPYCAECEQATKKAVERYPLLGIDLTSPAWKPTAEERKAAKRRKGRPQHDDD